MATRGAYRLAMIRRSRAMVVSPRLWKSRLVFWIGAVAIGAIAAGFAALSNLAMNAFTWLTAPGQLGPLAPLYLTPAGFALCALLADRFFPGTQGSGIPHVIAARHLREDEDRGGFLTPRIVVGKIFLTVAGLLCGASIGREGPTVQIGAALMLFAGRLGGMERARGLLLAGSAAGIAAAFNTPLAGIVFAIEEMGRSYQSRTNGIVLSAVIIAGVASLGLVGNYTYFGVTFVTAAFPSDWLLVIACGVFGGIAGSLFSVATLRITRRVRRLLATRRTRRLMLLAASAGLVVALTGLFTGGSTFGTGYENARSAIEGHALPPGYFPAKFLATLVSTVSGIPGGLFAPSLSVGAGLGSSLAEVMGQSIGLGAVLGMAGYFAGVVQAPMTAFVIIVEMTGDQANIVAVMAAAMIGYGIARIITPEPLYHALSRLLIADAIRRRRAEAQASLPDAPALGVGAASAPPPA